MNTGKLYGVSVGPGDPELITLRAARVLAEVDCVAAPDAAGSNRTALRIVERYLEGKEILDCTTPMTNDRDRTGAAYDAIAAKMAELLDAGKSVAFITLGDASVYSTWSYVCERMEGRGYQIEVVPGVTSFCAAAAVLRKPLCERSEQLLVSPVATGDAAAALDVPGTKVFMKSGRRIGHLRDVLRKRGLDRRASLVANCGLPGQQVVPRLDAAGELPGYMSVVIVKDPAGCASGPGDPDAPAGAAGRVHPGIAGIVGRIAPPDEAARKRSLDKWNAVAKPIGGLGVLEDDVMRMAALTGSEDVAIAKRAIVVMCADNGVVAEGVAQCGQDVTLAVADNIARRRSSVCAMASCAGIDVIAVDMGMRFPPKGDGVVDRCIARGTGNIACGPAMTNDQAVRAIEAGIGLVADLKEQGYRLIAAGEMGIGNTTTASAMSAVLLGMGIDEATGRGAGLSDEGLERKMDAIRRAIAVNAPDSTDALDVLAKLGGFDIAGLAGLFIGGALYRVPIVVDGFISALAAYVAKLLCPDCTCAMVASHVSAEPAARALLDALDIAPAIQAGMHLGEGTGAACLIPLLDMTLALYDGTTFAATGIDAYEVNP